MFKIKHFWQIDLPCVTPQELLYVSVTGFKGSGIGVKASLTTLMIACFIPAHQAHSEQILLWREKQCSRSSYSFKTSFQKGDKPFCHSNLSWKCIRSPQFRTWLYSRLSLSRIPRESLKYFEISVHRHIRFAVKEKMSRTATFNKCKCNLTPEDRDILKILWKRGAVSLFSIIFCYLLLDFHV